MRVDEHLSLASTSIFG